MKIVIFTIALIMGVTNVASQNLDNYKYVVVPESFGFLDTPNEYQLNALTKFLFEKKGFNTLMKTDQKPLDLKDNGCIGLYANVEEDSNLFVTKLIISLENCNGEQIFRSQEGASREKDYKTAHQEALREAFISFEELDYQYGGNSPSSSKDLATTAVEVKGEVAAQTPKKNMKAAAEEDEEMEIKVAETEITEESLDSYILDNAVYYLKKSDSGFSFYQKGMAEPFASLIKSEGQNSFIYNSVTKQGLAYFDNEENLVVEYFDRSKNDMIKIVYKVQD